jgi:hypothetical protein
MVQEGEAPATRAHTEQLLFRTPLQIDMRKERKGIKGEVNK